MYSNCKRGFAYVKKYIGVLQPTAVQHLCDVDFAHHGTFDFRSAVRRANKIRKIAAPDNL